MTPEEVAQRNSSRTGYRLVDYAEVALPAHVMTIEAVTLERKPLPVVELFALKALSAGLTTAVDIAGLLGIEEKVLRKTLVNLSRTEQIALTGAQGTRSHVLAITAKGKRTLAEATLTVPEEQTIQIVLDGLTRSVAHWRTSELILPKDLTPRGLLEIPSQFTKRPSERDIEVRQVQQYVNFITSDEVRRDVLAVRRVERVTRRFLPAVALFYVSNEGDAIQVAFAIDGRLSPAHEKAFVQGGGVERLRLRDAILQARDEDRVVLQTVNKLTRMFPRAEAAGATARRLEEQRVRLLDESADETVDVQGRELLEDVEKRADQLRQEPAISLTCYEHPAVLQRVLKEAARRLLIVSPWISPAVVDNRFVTLLRKLLERRVDVYIAYGLGEDKWYAADAIRTLEMLAAEFSNFRLKRVGNTHSKVLLCDDDTCVVSSFNWLSFKGDPNRTIRDERGVLVRDRSFVESQFRQELQAFFG